ncbi:MAG: nucleotidyl transferase AbiEii/AbiGii toxin family protein, partial [Candidatus Obscuribacterales bacterium]|nr:nucleotidyl transferase AbiEii/AbiGii toxin family protein [Candidatus Obscuribacterales bacterium]
MIPQSFIDAWRETAPWSSDRQVEQDLVVSRAVAELFADADLHELLALRGGTVLNKFFFGGGSRYSEDIDLVKVGTGKAGPLFDVIRKRLDPWLGSPKSEISDASIKLVYRFTSEADSAVKMRLKVEVNTRENFSVLGYQSLPFEVGSGWYSNQVHVKTFALNELLGTKIRALYQRRKGRDLFDLWYSLAHCDCSPEEIVHCFCKYMEHSGLKIGRKDLLANLEGKLSEKGFLTDIPALLRTGLNYDHSVAFEHVSEK